jgi:hypothetical protein
MNFWKKNEFVNEVRISVATLVIGILICTTNCFGGNKMGPLYDINEAATIRPEEYQVRGSNLSLFPVPQDNAVGTNDMGNAITLLSFHNGKPRADKFFRNAANDFEGGGTYLPVIDENTTGFAQSRRFLLFDFKSKDCRDYRIVMSIDKTIRKAAIADPLKKHFIFEVKEYNRHSEDHRYFTRRLLLMDLSGDEPKTIKEMNIGKVTLWTEAVGKNFLFNLKTNQMDVLDMSFSQSHHPLANSIKQHINELSFNRIHPHPYLPFAILAGGKKGSTYISWKAGRDNSPQPLFSGARDFSFSPDGKWVAFKVGGVMDIAKTYLMPVSEKYFNYLGSPILLANDYYDEGRFAWTTNPISFVGSSLGKLYRWELTNEAHPESDKPTFHDYIVEKDLEKLTREKKQGLGGTSE